jgi:hypothetical protein
MISGAGIGLVAAMSLLVLTGCSGAVTTACQCPKPVAYDDATITKISQALRALPPDNVLHRAMDDYEDERDELRICLAGARAFSDPRASLASRMPAQSSTQN